MPEKEFLVRTLETARNCIPKYFTFIAAHLEIHDIGGSKFGLSSVEVLSKLAFSYCRRETEITQLSELVSQVWNAATAST